MNQRALPDKYVGCYQLAAKYLKDANQTDQDLVMGLILYIGEAVYLQARDQHNNTDPMHVLQGIEPLCSALKGFGIGLAAGTFTLDTLHPPSQ